jgi:DNA-binding LacI/PurR family transcriptional regulator
MPGLERRYTESRIEELVQQALADTRVTALVGANDDAGLGILRYLERTHVKVPSTVSVVGFDGTRAGVLAGLSSYDYNTPAFVRAALEFVLNPRPGANPTQPTDVTVPGVLLPRATLTRPNT